MSLQRNCPHDQGFVGDLCNLCGLRLGLEADLARATGDEPYVRKEATQWAETRWYVECPYCGIVQGEEEAEYDTETDCEMCTKTFDVKGGRP